MIVRVQSTELSGAQRFVLRLVTEWRPGDEQLGGITLFGFPLPRPHRRSLSVADLLVWTPHGCTLVVPAGFGSVQHGVLDTSPAGRWRVGDRLADLRMPKSTPNPILYARKHRAELASLFRRAGLSEQIDILVVLIPKTGSRISSAPAVPEPGIEMILARIGQPASFLEYFARPPAERTHWRAGDIARAFDLLGIPGKLPEPEELADEGFPAEPGPAAAPIARSARVSRFARTAQRSRPGRAGPVDSGKEITGDVSVPGREYRRTGVESAPTVRSGGVLARLTSRVLSPKVAGTRAEVGSVSARTTGPRNFEADADASVAETGAGESGGTPAGVPAGCHTSGTEYLPGNARGRGVGAADVGGAEQKVPGPVPEVRTEPRRSSAADAVLEHNAGGVGLGRRPGDAGSAHAWTTVSQLDGVAGWPHGPSVSVRPAQQPVPPGEVAAPGEMPAGYRDPESDIEKQAVVPEKSVAIRSAPLGPVPAEAGGPGADPAAAFLESGHPGARTGAGDAVTFSESGRSDRRGRRFGAALAVRTSRGSAAGGSVATRRRRLPADSMNSVSRPPARPTPRAPRQRLRYPVTLATAAVAVVAVAATVFAASGFARFDVAEYGALCDGGSGFASAAPYRDGALSPVYLGGDLAGLAGAGSSAVWHPVDAASVQLVGCVAEVRRAELVRTCQYPATPGEPVGRTLNLFAMVYRLTLREARTGNVVAEREIVGDRFGVDPAVREPDLCRAAAGAPEDDLPGRRHSRPSSQQVHEIFTPFVGPEPAGVRAAR